MAVLFALALLAIPACGQERPNLISEAVALRTVRASFSPLGFGSLIVQFQNQGTAIGTYVAFLQINCSTNLTCSASGSTVTMTAAGSPAWSALGNASANLTLANAGFTTEFDQTSPVNWTWANTSPATSGANVASPIFNLNGSCWNGTASYLCGWTVQSSPAAGSNPQQNLLFTPVGAGSSNSAQMLLNLPASFSGFPFQVNAGGVGEFQLTTTSGYSALASMPAGGYLKLMSSNSAVVFSVNTAANTGLSTLNFALATGLNTVTFSATPTFNAALGNTQSITLTGNVTSSTLTNAVAGESLNFVICQDATGGRTFVWPTNVKGAMTIGSTLSTCSAQSFIFNGTNAYATSAGVTGM